MSRFTTVLAGLSIALMAMGTSLPSEAEPVSIDFTSVASGSIGLVG